MVKRASPAEAVRACAAVASLGFLAASLLIVNMRDQLQQTTVLMPVDYPPVFKVHSGTILSLSDVTTGLTTGQSVLPDNSDPWPFPDLFRPVNRAEYRRDDPNVIDKSANCPLNTWVLPEQYTPNAAPYMSWKQYGLPINTHCSQLPDAYKEDASQFEANKWSYACYSNGKCSLFTTDADEQPYSAAEAAAAPPPPPGVNATVQADAFADGIAREGQQGMPMPEGSPENLPI